MRSIIEPAGEPCFLRGKYNDTATRTSSIFNVNSGIFGDDGFGQ